MHDGAEVQYIFLTLDMLYLILNLLCLHGLNWTKKTVLRETSLVFSWGVCGQTP